MRFLHTADWHLGRVFHGTHLTEDQAHVLDQVVEVVRDARPDALVIAGDLYDRHVAPSAAIALLNDVLCRIADLGVPVLAIGGNHDAPERLGFGSRFLARGGLHLAGTVPDARIVTLHDAHGPVHFHLLPYAEPGVVREALEAPAATCHDTAMKVLLASDGLRVRPGERAVLVAHAFVVGGEACESERPLTIGGANQVDVSHFDPFHYVALGHLHRPQQVGRAAVRYSGSLLKYSFSETPDDKGVELVELDEAGRVQMERFSLTPRRDARRVEGRLADLLARPETFGPRADYLQVRLLDDGPVLDAMSRLRDVFPNVLELERAYLELRQGRTGILAGDHRTMSDEALFAAFFRDVMDRDLEERERAALAAATDEAGETMRDAQLVEVLA